MEEQVQKPENETPKSRWYLVPLHVLSVIWHVLFRVLGIVLDVFLTLLLVFIVAGVLVVSVFSMYVRDYVDPTFDTSLWLSAGSNTTSTIYYYKYDSLEDRNNRHGEPVEYATIYSSENSIWASYEEMLQIDPDGTKHSYLVDAFISMEDHRFWAHNGVDWTRTASAAIGYAMGSSSYGGSTITQQLVKNLTGHDEVKVTRKIQEILQALDLAKKKSREEILEMYMNIVYLGNNCYGVQSAARYYFGKDVAQLTLEECAALASVVKNPS
ncbi:MAG: transglycosylase domain-containing protein, partial [Clostridia bacterium]|nr:transglycosylase domain-containing protein [Clostridia bacterium]